VGHRWGKAAAGFGFPGARRAAPRDSEDDDDDDGLGRNAAGLTLLAHALLSLVAQLGVKPEVFTMGPASQAIGAATPRPSGLRTRAEWSAEWSAE
jgi:hypothetical protein